MNARSLLAAGALALAGCASTTLTSQWADPALGTTKFDRIAVVFQHPDTGLRRSLEDAMAQPGDCPMCMCGRRGQGLRPRCARPSNRTPPR